jgi:acetyl esterase
MAGKKQTKTKHFYAKKWFLWTLGVFFGFIVLVLFAFRVSPWPGALIIRDVFNKDDIKVLAALEKHTPSTPVAELSEVQYKQGDAGAFLDVYYPQNTSSSSRLPVIIWTHGGAWVSGDKNNVAPYYRLLAAEGFTVIAVDYGLAPEHTYPTAVHQLNDAYAYIQQNAERFRADTGNIILAGDSAGANLSSQMAAIITNPTYAKEVGVTPNLQASQLKGVVLNCGIYKMHELTVPNPTLPKIVGWGTDVSVWAYSGTRDFSAPIIKEMSAYYHATSNFPPVYISGGNGDLLTKVQSVPFADKLKSLGVAVDELFYPDDHQPSLPHEYQFNMDGEDGTNALKRTIEFAKRRTQSR